jgi:uncharacterized protein
VLAYVQDRGPTHPNTLADRFGREREMNGWGGMSKATTRALQILLHHGRLRVVRRDAGTRVYDVAAKPTTAWEGKERVEQLMLRLTTILAPVSTQSLLATMAPIIRSVLGPGARTTTLATLLQSGALTAVEVDGVRYVTPAALQLSSRTQQAVRFLAPFDPLVWDRRRFEHLWGWPYRFEAYTPLSRRRLGYYAMPLLWRDAVIGWVNCSRRNGKLDVQPGFVVSRPTEAGFDRAFDAEVARMERFLATESGTTEDVV